MELVSKSFRRREVIKALGHRIFREASSVEGKSKGRMEVAYSHFLRSRERAEKEGRSHPGYREYFHHWLWSEPEYEDPDVLDLLNDLYPYIHPDRTQVKGSYWFNKYS